ncbi:diguanylate cyclase domain-containing protein [Niveibacterium sp.]|uniref:diguanylate cyclase domain-containing protein n=1 Tax=Niveibacterium sp. TaxID=2017444 RepID=UPI0035B0C72E
MAPRILGVRTLPLFALVVTALFEVSAARDTAAWMPFLTMGVLALVGIWHAGRAASAASVVQAYVDAAAAVVLISVLGSLAFGRAGDAMHLAGHAAHWSPAFAVLWFSIPGRSLGGSTLRSIAFTGVLVSLAGEGLEAALQTSLLTLIVAVVAVANLWHSNRPPRAGERRGGDTMHDAVTGLASLQAFESELAQLAAISDRYAVPVTMLFVRVMVAGSPLKEEVLTNFGEQLYRRIRMADTACHARGGDFYVLLPNTTVAGARQIADDIGACLASAQVASGPVHTVEVLVEQHCTGEDPMCMIERAERRLAGADQA